MKIIRRGSAGWSGAIKEGTGSISTGSGALTDFPYGFGSRFGDLRGTNPEELLGAAHSGCFTMALSLALGEAGFTPKRLDTKADVSLEHLETGFSITAVHLSVKGTVPGINAETFKKIAEGAKANCPVSKVLRAEISLDVELLD